MRSTAPTAEREPRAHHYVPHVLLFRTNQKVKPMQATYRHVAAQNTFMMLTADEQVYSHEPDVYWLDESGNCQTDWRLFSKEKILQSGSVGVQIAAYAV